MEAARLDVLGPVDDVVVEFPAEANVAGEIAAEEELGTPMNGWAAERVGGAFSNDTSWFAGPFRPWHRSYTHTPKEGTSMADRQLILAVFPDELAADNAAMALKESGIADGDAIGILALDSHGKLKQDKVGARSTGKGAAIGGVLFLLGPAVLGVGVIGGAAAGALHHKNLGLTDADKARLTVELTEGKAAVGVMARFDTAPAISDRLTQLGGTPETHELTDEAIEAATLESSTA